MIRLRWWWFWSGKDSGSACLFRGIFKVLVFIVFGKLKWVIVFWYFGCYLRGVDGLLRGCGRLWLVTGGYRKDWLWLITGGCYWKYRLWLIIGSCYWKYWLWLIVGYLMSVRDVVHGLCRGVQFKRSWGGYRCLVGCCKREDQGWVVRCCGRWER